MPRATHADVAQRAAAAFRPSGQVRIGAELESLVFHRSDPTLPVPAPRSAAVAAGPLPAGGTITIELGGQVELFTRPAPDATTLITAIETDTEPRQFAPPSKSSRSSNSNGEPTEQPSAATTGDHQICELRPARLAEASAAMQDAVDG